MLDLLEIGEHGAVLVRPPDGHVVWRSRTGLDAAEQLQRFVRDAWAPLYRATPPRVFGAPPSENASPPRRGRTPPTRSTNRSVGSPPSGSTGRGGPVMFADLLGRDLAIEGKCVGHDKILIETRIDQIAQMPLRALPITAADRASGKFEVMGQQPHELATQRITQRGHRPSSGRIVGPRRGRPPSKIDAAGSLEHDECLPNGHGNSAFQPAVVRPHENHRAATPTPNP